MAKQSKAKPKRSRKQCPVTTFADLFCKAFDHVRRGINRWGSTKLVPLDYSMLHPKVPKRLKIGQDWWTRIKTPPLVLCVGLGFEAKKPSEWKSTHLHGDLDTGLVKLHLDYFDHITWGPLCGVYGFIVSSGGKVLGAGGNWGQPPGGGSRNWPLGVLVSTDELLTIFGTFKRKGDTFLCKDFALWRRETGGKRI